jgi:hypothetical protein
MKLRMIFIGLFAFLFVSPVASAVTIVAGNSYQLTGSIVSHSTDAEFTGLYDLSSPDSISYLTVNFDNTISVVLNLTQADGDKAVLEIKELVYAEGPNGMLNLSAPAGAKTFASGCKHIGDFYPVNNPTAFTQFTIAGNNHKINTIDNSFGLAITSYYDQADRFLGRNNISFNIGGLVNTQVPEPMTLSLMGLGLLGGALKRRRSA